MNGRFALGIGPAILAGLLMTALPSAAQADSPLPCYDTNGKFIGTAPLDSLGHPMTCGGAPIISPQSAPTPAPARSRADQRSADINAEKEAKEQADLAQVEADLKDAQKQEAQAEADAQAAQRQADEADK